MALSKAVLGPLLQASVDALSANDKKDRAKVFEALADAIITHITTAGVVTVLVTAVTPGGGTAPGTGTIT